MNRNVLYKIRTPLEAALLRLAAPLASKVRLLLPLPLVPPFTVLL